LQSGRSRLFAADCTTRLSGDSIETGKLLKAAAREARFQELDARLRAEEASRPGMVKQ
jgi:hypothetical protein